MNALYVAVSLNLLLVLAGFNHAHGLTTFGKSNSNNAQPAPQPAAQAKHCTTQASCSFIKGTTCLRMYCLCGDNSYPINGKCKDVKKAPQHLCGTDDECIDGADCLPPKSKNNRTISELPTSDVKICTCQEGLVEKQSYCGASSISILPFLASIILAALSRIIN